MSHSCNYDQIHGEKSPGTKFATKKLLLKKCKRLALRYKRRKEKYIRFVTSIEITGRVNL